MDFRRKAGQGGCPKTGHPRKTRQRPFKREIFFRSCPKTPNPALKAVFCLLAPGRAEQQQTPL
jgi:hypothetical protein